MKNAQIQHFVNANQRAWDASATQHRDAASWQALLSAVSATDFSCLDASLTALLQVHGVTGKDVIQLGCNNGRECLSLMSLGANSVLGVDQSREFLAQASELTALSAHQAEFVEADIYKLPDELQQRFDLALITIGVLNWMPDLPAFFASVSATLRPGGSLVIYESHPFLEMFEPEASDPHQLAYSYFRTAPLISEEAIVYQVQQAETISPSYWFIHTLSEILTAILASGLQITHFKEYPHNNREALYDGYQGQSAQLPMCYSLVGKKTL